MLYVLVCHLSIGSLCSFSDGSSFSVSSSVRVTDASRLVEREQTEAVAASWPEAGPAIIGDC